MKFQASLNALIFNEADEERRFITHNADLLGMAAPELEAEGVLKRLLAGQRDCSTSRLGAATASDQGKGHIPQLMEEARRELARHYLLHSSLALNETAYLSGYQDANSFFRAFQQWEGTSPGDWRATHRVSPTQTILPPSARVNRENYNRAI